MISDFRGGAWMLVGAGGSFPIIFVGVEWIYNVVLVSGVQPNESVTCTHISILFTFFSHLDHYRVLLFPVLYSRFSIVIYFICCSDLAAAAAAAYVCPSQSPIYSSPHSLILW